MTAVYACFSVSDSGEAGGRARYAPVVTGSVMVLCIYSAS